MARLPLGFAEQVLGVPASALTGQVVALDALWGAAETRRLVDGFAQARDTSAAAAILESAVAKRLAFAQVPRDRTRLVLAAADRLACASVNTVAGELGLSERHLRRLFHETIGMGPKSFAKLTRFRRAVRAARETSHAGWASIALAAGYYDQAHLISEFRLIAGATPEALVSELRAAQSLD